jgi:hypothetical protein
MNEQLWWHLSRATGIVAWALAVAAVLWGLALSTRAAGKRPGPGWLLDLHRYLGGLTLAFTAAHVGALVADSYVHFGVADVLVPFAADWRTGPVALGVLAMWTLLAVELTSLAKRRLPARAWRTVHLTSYLGAAAATAHLVTAGTDAMHPALRWGPALAVSAASFFLTYRLLVPRRGRAVRASAA